MLAFYLNWRIFVLWKPHWEALKYTYSRARARIHIDTKYINYIKMYL